LNGADAFTRRSQEIHAPFTGLRLSYAPHPSCLSAFGGLTPHKEPSMPVTQATIRISNLRLRTFIGFNPEEREKKQDVVINIQIGYRMNEAALQDDVDSALNYKTVTKQVIEHVEQGQFLLLEKLVAEVLAICSEHSSVTHAAVTIDKPHALRFADSVSLTLEYNAERQNTVRLLEKAS
jgi:D-erythro-7,8-dihydroneopterin triphosphate epimerase